MSTSFNYAEMIVLHTVPSILTFKTGAGLFPLQKQDRSCTAPWFLQIHKTISKSHLTSQQTRGVVVRSFGGEREMTKYLLTVVFAERRYLLCSGRFPLRLKLCFLSGVYPIWIHHAGIQIQLNTAKCICTRHGEKCISFRTSINNTSWAICSD